VTAAIDNLVAAVEEGSVTTEIVAAATEKGGDSATVFESVTVDKTAFVAPEIDDVVKEVTEVDCYTTTCCLPCRLLLRQLQALD
jgi:hypothetical protein